VFTLKPGTIYGTFFCWFADVQPRQVCEFI
jgi:hypothetical protein